MASQLHQSRLHAFRQQQGKCFYCGLPMWGPGDPPGPSQLRCTAEHLLARFEGGTHGRANIVAACAHCNMTRHLRKRPPEPLQYRRQVRRRVAAGRWFPRSVLSWAGAQAAQAVDQWVGGACLNGDARVSPS